MAFGWLCGIGLRVQRQVQHGGTRFQHGCIGDDHQLGIQFLLRQHHAQIRTYASRFTGAEEDFW